MISVVAKNYVKEKSIEAYKNKTVELISKTRQEVGCITYSLFEDVNNPQILTFIEEWESLDHLKAHMNSEHFKAIVPTLKTLCEKEGEVNLYSKCD